MDTIVFDMYGVIAVDPEGALLPFVRQTFPDKGRDEVYPAWHAANAGQISSLDFWAEVGYSGDLRAVETRYLDSIVLDEGFYPLARELKKSRRLALLSNDLASWSAYLRKKHGLDALFDVVTVSGEVGCSKPDPRIYRILLAELAAPPASCCLIDDRLPNLQAARELGLQTIHFQRRRAATNLTPADPPVENFAQLTGRLTL
jgi:putative hydrolase of the HAD superfamily